ncbi:hypothetical protein JCM8097_001924 [Rhodosporidiobolus ruineniae]
MAPILLLSRLTALLTHLTSPSGSPHTALLCALHQGGAVLASASQPTEPPFPPAALEEEIVDQDQRARCYAALAVGSWAEHRQANGQHEGNETEPVMLETELGRIAIVALSSFLLVLVGNDVAPWKVLDKKIRLAAEQLKEPLEKVAA